MSMYKVVRQSKYRSVMAGGKARIRYEVGKWITAPEWLAKQGYHPLCFRSLEEAHETIQKYTWHLPHHDIAIWKVSTRDVISHGNLPPICINWYLEQGELTPCGTSYSWPKGTIMARAVRLEEKVWDSKEGEQ